MSPSYHIIVPPFNLFVTSFEIATIHCRSLLVQCSGMDISCVEWLSCVKQCYSSFLLQVQYNTIQYNTQEKDTRILFHRTWIASIVLYLWNWIALYIYCNCQRFRSWYLNSCISKKNLNASRPSEHPPFGFLNPSPINNRADSKCVRLVCVLTSQFCWTSDLWTHQPRSHRRKATQDFSTFLL